MASASSNAGVDVVVVNWNSGEGLGALLADLDRQEGVDLRVTVVDNGSTDGSAAGVNGHVQLIRAGANLGYAAGNNLAFRALGLDRPVLVVNPDVRLPDPSAIASLAALLGEHPRLAALAPTIRADEGLVEYRGSRVDPDRALAVHTETHVPGWPADAAAVCELSWIDGAAVLFRPEALAKIGHFDERYFLFHEEVDWCLRAARGGWTLGVATGVDVRHARSSSFGRSTKGTYYYWRNLYLLCKLHARGRVLWRLHWGRGLARFSLQRGHVRTGNTVQGLRAARDAVLGRFGPGPEDRS
jgi:GT2 family glycosyltransferase